MAGAPTWQPAEKGDEFISQYLVGAGGPAIDGLSELLRAQISMRGGEQEVSRRWGGGDGWGRDMPPTVYKADKTPCIPGTRSHSEMSE